VYYSAPIQEGAPPGWNHTSHISEFRVSADNPDAADPGSERILLRVAQPQMNHDGGQIAFGPDGTLYIPLGDGGAADDVAEGHVEDWYEANAGGNGQDLTENMLGSILRIDVNSGDPYGIPPDNPWVNEPGIPPEQWAYGFRNPYRISFDRGGDHWLYVGDAGQNLWEEVSVAQAGGNYGWNVLEGTHCFSTDNPDAEAENCPQTDPEGDPLIPPVIEFRNINQADGVGLTVVGGNVYRGSAIPDLFGMYVFGSWSSSWSQMQGQLFMAIPRSLDGGLWQTFALPTAESGMGLLNAAILSFGEDWNGELYVLTSQDLGPTGSSGQIWRIVPAE
jgi:glucose/arabinose dehydrogenase